MSFDESSTLPLESVVSSERLPTQVAPSRLKDFVQCPRLFYYKAILRLPVPPTLATLKGNLAHVVFDRIFDHPRPERTVEVALTYVAPALRAMRHPFVDRDAVDPTSPEARIRDHDHRWTGDLEPASYLERQYLATARDLDELVPEGSDVEATLLADTRVAVENYFQVERPWNFDPEGRELHLQAQVLGVPLHGYLDRLDRYETRDGEERWVISDYKTGKVPSPRYLDEAFFAMRVYAVLLLATHHVVAHSLRLVYVTAEKEKAVVTLTVDQLMLERTQQEMKRLWGQIKRSAQQEKWEPNKGPLCNWCHFQDICPAWNPALAGIVEGAPEPEPRRRR